MNVLAALPTTSRIHHTLTRDEYSVENTDRPTVTASGEPETSCLLEVIIAALCPLLLRYIPAYVPSISSYQASSSK